MVIRALVSYGNNVAVFREGDWGPGTEGLGIAELKIQKSKFKTNVLLFGI